MPKRKLSSPTKGPEEASSMIQPFKKKNNVDQSERKKERNRALVAISKFLSVSDIYAKAWAQKKQQLNYVLRFNDKIKYFEGSLREYQKVGVKWMETLYQNGINGILADEMGLGKTVQVIAFLCSLHTHGVNGMHLISVPLSTMHNWLSEIKRFAPTLPVIQYCGSREEREKASRLMVAASMKAGNDKTTLFPIVVVPHHHISTNIDQFLGINFVYLIIDEGHVIKNHNSQRSQAFRQINCKSKLLITGTPLQNNMQELWSLLNFIMPKIFADMEIFDQLIQTNDLANETMITSNLEESTTVLEAIQRVLTPFMLRRLKVDVLSEKLPIRNVLVYCEMTAEQIEMYEGALKSDIARLRGESFQKEVPLDKAGRKFRASITDQVLQLHLPQSDDSKGWKSQLVEVQQLQSPKPAEASTAYMGSLNQPMMMYRRIVNHPHLVSAPLIPGTPHLLVDERLVSRSGKMRMLDALLPRLLKRGHKVIIFSTLVIMLDLIDDYLTMRGIARERFTGSDSLEARSESITRFNTDESVRVFILSTRAGGLGINLTKADTVIFYDNDWNPHADLQAQARCHRIGQTKPVLVYTLIARNSIDEYIMRTAELKLRLEKAVMLKEPREISQQIEVKQELLDFLRCQNDSAVSHPNGMPLSDEQLDKLLDRSDLEKEMMSTASPETSTGA